VISQPTPFVVGVDGSERSLNALALATRLANPRPDLLLTHVHDYDRISTRCPAAGVGENRRWRSTSLSG
jgi:hypothetical protein